MNELFQCRICLEDSSNKTDFIVPCLCSGSAKYVHRKCLDEWRSQNPDGENFKTCNTCKYNYEIIESYQDPILEKRRKASYQRAIRLSIISVIFYIISLVGFMSILIYVLDYLRITNLHKRFKKYFPFCSLIVYIIAGITILLLIISIIGITTIIINNFVMLSSGGYSYLLTMLNPFNIIWMIIVGVIVGFVSVFFGILYYMDMERKSHIKRIWLKREAIIKQVRDFGEAGPPRI